MSNHLQSRLMFLLPFRSQVDLSRDALGAVSGGNPLTSCFRLGCHTYVKWEMSSASQQLPITGPGLPQMIPLPLGFKLVCQINSVKVIAYVSHASIKETHW